MPLGEKTKELWKNPEYREHMRLVHLGQKSWNKGKHIQTNTGRTHFKKGLKHTDNWYKSMTDKMSGELNPIWKGDKVGYHSLHRYIERNFGKENKCEYKDCKYPRKIAKKVLLKATRFEWANITGVYDRDRKNWARLCSSCHRLFDKNKITL